MEGPTKSLRILTFVSNAFPLMQSYRVWVVPNTKSLDVILR